MKKILLCVMLCLFFATAVFAAGNTKHVPMSADTTNRVMNRLAGDWYDSTGKLVMTIKNGGINGCPVVGASDFAGGDPGDGLFQIQESTGTRDVKYPGIRIIMVVPIIISW